MPKKENKLSSIQVQRVVGVLKEANLYMALLDEKSEEFVRSLTRRYAKYGVKMQISVKQLEWLESIGHKLFGIPGDD